jgi:hypothetical protein
MAAAANAPSSRVYCIHCHAVSHNACHEIICLGCGRLLHVRPSYSRRLDAVMGVAEHAEPDNSGDLPFRGDFTFRNSQAAINRFPFPFTSDSFMYAVNLRPHLRGEPGSVFAAAFDLDEHYEDECADRALTLAADPWRCQVLPHLAQAEWDTLALLMESFAADYPAWFSLAKSGDAWHWINRKLGLEQRFTFGDPASLPCPPFEYITRQAQGDFTLQDQRDGTLYLDGGMVTAAADWSLNFNLGMSFQEWHAPVPVAGALGVFDRAERFLLRLKEGAPSRRLNWSLTVNPRLDTGTEAAPFVAADKASLTAQNIAEKLCLRVELQTLTRLAPSGAILFGIRVYLIRMRELTARPEWARHLHRVLRGLHPEILHYKGLAGYHGPLLDYLAAFDRDSL